MSLVCTNALLGLDAAWSGPMRKTWVGPRENELLGFGVTTAGTRCAPANHLVGSPTECWPGPSPWPLVCTDLIP